jgi:hypothetical protein
MADINWFLDLGYHFMRREKESGYRINMSIFNLGDELCVSMPSIY